MFVSFLLQELHQKVTEKIKAAKALRIIMAIVIAAALVAMIFLAVKANTTQSSAGTSPLPSNSTAQSAQSAAVPGSRNQSEAALQAKTNKRIENVASILGIAVLTSGVMMIYYKKKEDRVEALPVLRNEEETH